MYSIFLHGLKLWKKKTKKAKEQNNKKKSILIRYFYQKLNPNYSIKTITKKNYFTLFAYLY